MVRQDDVSALADEQPIPREDSARLERFDLFEKHRRVDDRALTHDARGLLMKDPRRNQVENQLVATDDQRVPGVCASRVSNDQLREGRVQVNDLAFAFVAPLGAHYHHCTHDSFPARAHDHTASSGAPDAPRLRPSSIRVSFPFAPGSQISKS